MNGENNPLNILVDAKKSFYGILTLFFLVLTAVLIYSVFWGPAKKYTDSLFPARTVNVSAEGKVTVTPDVAKFTFTVVTQGSDPDSVADQNNKKMNQAIEFVKSQGIDAKDIKTVQYNLYPKYSYEEKTGRSLIYAYEMNQTALVKIRDFKKIGGIFGALPEYGINQIGQISFEIDEPEKYLAEARGEAFKAVKEKADKMSREVGVRLGNIINFSEYQQGPIPRYYEALGKGGEAGAPTVAPSIEPGSQEVSVSVNVTYEIK